MNTKYKYIHFDDYSRKDQRTKRFMCINNHGTWIGEVSWHPGWRQYCFKPASDTIFNSGCLDDINDFIKQLMDARKANK